MAMKPEIKAWLDENYSHEDADDNRYHITQSKLYGLQRAGLVRVPATVKELDANGDDELAQICRRFLAYRDRSDGNWQMEKADDFFFQMRKVFAGETK